jgi:hypothetical protein
MSPTLKLRNRPPAAALVRVAYSQAWTAMRLLISFLLAWPRTTRAAFGIGAVVLLFYGASFLTRDWRTIVPTVDQPAATQAATRSKAEPRSLPSKLADLPVPVEPATTGALTRITPAVPAPSAAETITPQPASAPARVQARSAAPRSPKQAKQGHASCGSSRRRGADAGCSAPIADRVHTALARSRRSDVSLVFPTPSLTVAPYPSSDLPASRRPQAVTVYAAAAGAL